MIYFYIYYKTFLSTEVIRILALEGFHLSFIHVADFQKVIYPQDVTVSLLNLVLSKNRAYIGNPYKVFYP